VLLLLTVFGACNDAGFALVSVDPIYGWTDGCNAITLSGHGFGKDVKATLGGAEITGLTAPEAPKDGRPSEVGYMLSGVAPAGAKGYADVTLTSGGQTSTLTGTSSYYYVECPAAGTLDAVTPSEGLAGGALVTLTGCGLDSAAITARIVDAAGTPQGTDLPLTSSCGKGTVTFEAPTLADGTWYLELVDVATNTPLTGIPCAPADTADSGSSCTDHPLVYGAAQ